jgi:hypothetical protein
MSEIKVNAIKKRNGSSITIGENGDTVTVTAGATLSGSGASLTALNGSNVASGTVANARLVGSGAITINGSAVSLGGSVTIGETKPTITGVTPSTIPNTATNVTIAGTNFVSVPQVEAISSTGAVTAANSVTFTSATSITANFTLTTDGVYFIRVENNDGNAVRSGAILTVSDAPTWTTGAGSLGTIAGGFSGTVATVAATGDSTLSFSETTSVLTNASQANCSLNSATGVITTTDFGGSSTSATTYNFTLRVTDAEGQTADRAFSLTSSFELEDAGRFTP